MRPAPTEAMGVGKFHLELLPVREPIETSGLSCRPCQPRPPPNAVFRPHAHRDCGDTKALRHCLLPWGDNLKDSIGSEMIFTFSVAKVTDQVSGED